MNEISREEEAARNIIEAWNAYREAVYEEHTERWVCRLYCDALEATSDEVTRLAADIRGHYERKAAP